MSKNEKIQFFKDRLLASIQGESVPSFARKCGMSETVIRDYLSGKTYPSLSRLGIIAENCGASFNWLATGYSLEEIESNSDETVYNEKIHRIPVYSKQMPSVEEAKTQKYVRDSPPVMNYPVLAGWLAYRGLNPADMIIYWAKGNLMEPEIKNNNGLIIDTSTRNIVDGGIYLVEYGDMTLLRRIHLTINGWLLQNNNSAQTLEVHKNDFGQYDVIGIVVQVINDI
ncbi:XRE family transcriptional regulator [Orbus sturtevantii]|uniref:LexA family transcriptional regulator n=1 Tax=Orbus sturtevantii TaxID=3074109 RepID=UPI00370D4C5A